MAVQYSQNGWIAGSGATRSTRNVPGTNVYLTVHDGPPGDLLIYVAEQFDKRVEDIDNARGTSDDGGYNFRPISGSNALSNHASATAIDLNWSKHPLGAVGTFTSNQVSTIHQILAECSWAIRWGGDYTGRKDEMHFEVITDWAGCQRAVDTIKARQLQQEEDMVYVHVEVPHGYAYDKTGSLVDPAKTVVVEFPPNVDLNGGWYCSSTDGRKEQHVNVRVAANVEDGWWDVKVLDVYPGNRIHATSIPINRSFGKFCVGRMEPNTDDEVVKAELAVLPVGFAVAK